jgi:hypothetical protein
VVEIGLKPKDLKKLEKALPEYVNKRERGMHAGILAQKLGLPLKDVMSFLIQKDILKDEQVDLELTRVILSRNPDLKQSIMRRIDMQYEKFDRALAIQDEKILKEICWKSDSNEMYVLLPQFVILLGVMQLPYSIALMICMALATLLLNGTLQRVMSRSSIETIMKMLTES